MTEGLTNLTMSTFGQSLAGQGVSWEVFELGLPDFTIALIVLTRNDEFVANFEETVEHTHVLWRIDFNPILSIISHFYIYDTFRKTYGL